jgi:hypothetical protein
VEKAAVLEYLLLLQANETASDEEITIALDTVWSLQYMARNIVCASAGAITSITSSPSNQAPSAAALNFTHVVHFRLMSRGAFEEFMAHPMTAKVMSETIAPLCKQTAQVVFEGLVTKQLEALFRRGEEFESGLEHVIMMVPGQANPADAQAFLGQLATLAESSVAGGIQASYGAALCCPHLDGCTHVFMTRFAAKQQIQQFLMTPPCQAVLSHDSRLPVWACMSFTFDVSPTQDSQTVDSANVKL